MPSLMTTSISPQKKSNSKHTSQSARIQHKTAQTSASASISDSTSASASIGLFPVPAKPAYIFSNCRNFLTDYEESEILNYREVYYLRPEPVQSKKAITQIPNFFHFVKNDHIAYRYQQLQVIGKGSFGSVFECYDHKNNEKVAIKMLRDKPKIHSQIVFELDLLKMLQSNSDDDDDHHIIRYIESFTFRGFFCIVMELLSIDIYAALKYQRFIGFRKSVIQMVARQTAEALAFIHKTGIIHADIKPENILFLNKEQTAIKVIDYGCSCFVGKLLFSYIQSRYYRAPEVVFGMQYSTGIDIWSLGCVLCEMVTGKPLFCAEDEFELMQMLVEVLGLPPDSMTKSGTRAHHFFDEKGQLKVKPNSRGKYHIPSSSSIELQVHSNDPSFISLIEGCLRWDPKERFTAEDILNHQWVKTIRHDETPRSATRPGAESF
ncbi:hypothetical protein M9Y10_020245 [Tritrichomonas musculus]|uniref:dual-specificity kinase n=1 Tax=Tritrichomonas musculus TaxID=1915356 RepID=A0ABR2HHN4_9EUKA